MSVFALPRWLPRRSRLVLFAAFTVIGDDGWIVGEGNPPSAMRTLTRLCDAAPSNVRRSLRLLESAELATCVMRRFGRSFHLAVRIHLGELRVEGSCAECGSPSRGTGRWCAYCKQVVGRDDRAWQTKALELWGMGLSPPRIAARLRLPMFERRSDDGREAGGAAIVPFLVAHPDLADWPEREAWSQRLREMGKGSGVSDE